MEEDLGNRESRNINALLFLNNIFSIREIYFKKDKKVFILLYSGMFS